MEEENDTLKRKRVGGQRRRLKEKGRRWGRMEEDAREGKREC